MKFKYLYIPEGQGKDRLEKLRDYLPELCLFTGPWLAGGAVRRMFIGENIDSADMDFFFPSYTSWFEACVKIERVADARLETKQANTYRVPMGDGNQIVQLIRKEYPSHVMNLLRTFDYRVCQFVTDGNLMAYPESAGEDAIKKRLRLAYEGKLETRGLYARLQKYLSYGFTPGSDLLLSVLTKVRTKNGQQIANMSAAYTHSDTKLDKSDPTGLGAGWVPLLPSEKIIV